LSNSSVHQHHSIVHASLGRAVKCGILQTNPADRASPPTLKRTTVGAPAVADVQRLIAATESSDPVLASAIALGAVTGARRGELGRS
jgi:integrase